MIKTGKTFLNNKSNTNTACVYNNPKNSTFTKENECNVLDLIKSQLTKFSKPNQITIREDFLDFLPKVYTSELNTIPELDTSATYRSNEDVSLNNYGEQFIHLYRGSKLKVLKDRTRKDIQEHFNYLGF